MKTADARRADEVRQQEQMAERETAAAERTEAQISRDGKADQKTLRHSQGIRRLLHDVPRHLALDGAPESEGR